MAEERKIAEAKRFRFGIMVKGMGGGFLPNERTFVTTTSSPSSQYYTTDDVNLNGGIGGGSLSFLVANKWFLISFGVNSQYLFNQYDNQQLLALGGHIGAGLTFGGDFGLMVDLSINGLYDLDSELEYKGIQIGIEPKFVYRKDRFLLTVGLNASWNLYNGDSLSSDLPTLMGTTVGIGVIF